MEQRARKRFGQNFLVDPQVIQRIVDAIAPGPQDSIVEIGPGRAALTTELVRSGARLTLLEIDRDLAADLRSRFERADNVAVCQQDALRADFGRLVDAPRFRLVGNLPYNISTPLLFHALAWSERIIDMHFMLQREVVERMAAGPGGKDWGRLSIMCQLRCAVTPLFTVSPEAFRPVPRVQSAVVRLLPHRQPPVQVNDTARFDDLVRTAFSQRRKTLRNSLRRLLSAEAIAAAGIDPGLRPEALGLQQFAALANQQPDLPGS